jgi:hypothetical protein
MTPPVRPDDVVKLALGPKKAHGLSFTTWEIILSEIIVGDAFGALIGWTIFCETRIMPEWRTAGSTTIGL